MRLFLTPLIIVAFLVSNRWMPLGAYVAHEAATRREDDSSKKRACNWTIVDRKMAEVLCSDEVQRRATECSRERTANAERVLK